MRDVTSIYRKDIEGLRAIAILLVVAAHMGGTWFSGGFIGVDIFFVMSGYLITGLLLKEIDNTGKVNFLAFYVARLKRLLPALLFMLLATSTMAVFLLSPYEHVPQAISASYAAIWLSNLYFSFAKLDYFEPAADENMYLHTWSLGVEEQFYLIWPFLIMLFIGGWRWQRGQKNVKRLLLSMVGVLAIFLTLSIVLSYKMPALGFYLMPSRAWQFALGAFALLWPVFFGAKEVSISNLEFSKRQGLLLHILAWLGLLAIIVSALKIHSDMVYPSFWALFPSVATALVLILGARKVPSVLSRLLSVKPMLWLGKISYSWYLWHWPILVLGDKLFQHDGPMQKWLLILVSLLFSIFSYVVVESPARKSRYLVSKPVVTLTGALLLMVSVFSVLVYWESLAKEWVKSPEQSIFDKVHNDVPVTYSMGCDEWYHSAEVKFCIFGDKNAEHTAILIGDSVGAQWSPALARRYVKKNWKFIVLTKSSCTMIDEPYFYRRIGREYTECSTWRKNAVKWMKAHKPDIVFMGSTIARFERDQWVGGTTRILNDLTRSAGDIYIIRSTPALLFDGPLCLSQQQWRQRWLPTWLPLQSDCSAVIDSPYGEKVYQWLKEAASGFDNVRVINMNPIVCPNNRCSAFQDGRAVYRDAMHLSKSYVWSIAPKFFQEMHSN